MSLTLVIHNNSVTVEQPNREHQVARSPTLALVQPYGTDYTPGVLLLYSNAQAITRISMPLLNRYLVTKRSTLPFKVLIRSYTQTSVLTMREQYRPECPAKNLQYRNTYH